MAIPDMSSRLLIGKVIVVTGGSSGIGKAIAVAAARHGARAVVCGDLIEQPKEGGPSTAELVAQHGAEFRYVQTDVTDRDQISRLVAMADEFGGLDTMVANAGIALPTDGADVTEADFARLFSVNLQGALTCAQLAATSMRDTGKQGSIVFISSMGGLRGSAVNTGYCATKGGMNLLTASLADAWGPEGLRVNAICPGLIDTELVKSSPKVGAAIEGLRQRMPLRRLGQASEIGDAVAWIASDFASFVSGASIPVDGGLTAVI